MDDVVKKVYEAISYRLDGVTLDDFIGMSHLFEFHPVKYQGELIGAMVTYKNHVHACIDPDYKGKWFGRVALRVINDIIKKHGEALSSATTEDGHNILLSLGFVKDGEIYRSTKTWALKR
jgi:GNAT superfamily N-acetyltransferase